MRFKHLSVVLLAGVLFFSAGCGKKAGGGENPLYSDASTPSSEIDAKFLLEWWDALFAFVGSERLSPPDASRMFAYISVGLYEAQICGTPNYLTLENQLSDFENVPRPEKGQVYDWQTCVTETMYLVQDGMMARYFPAGVSTLNKLYDKQIEERKAAGVTDEVIERSKAYGEELADAILEWSEGDSYVETRYKQYKAPSREGHPSLWEPTDFNQTALEPFWGDHRTFFVKDGAQCDIDKAPAYNGKGDTTSELYKQAVEVYKYDTELTEEQRTIAQYWADDPSETSTPPGHWMEILGNFVQSENMKLDRAAELYALVATAMNDACITVWHTKYRVNLVRPKTVIRETIDPAWEPYVETPPFAGYTSGHSGFSGAAATILTGLIGDNLSFIDSAHIDIGLLPREFKSFQAAADEAAFSRMYGGIHFTCDIFDGVEQGRCVGNFYLENLKTNPGRKKGAAAGEAKKEE
jgi:hypothetical protein